MRLNAGVDEAELEGVVAEAAIASRKMDGSRRKMMISRKESNAPSTPPPHERALRYQEVGPIATAAPAHKGHVIGPNPDLRGTLPVLGLPRVVEKVCLMMKMRDHKMFYDSMSQNHELMYHLNNCREDLYK
jgi:hypothetical protein